MSRKVKILFITFLSLLAYLLCVFILYTIEAQQEDSNIKSFGDALWYSVITLTTIGYGDYFPKTFAGRLVSLVFVFGSIGILGFVISQISNKIYKFMEEKKLGYFGTKFENHVVLINWNPFGREILNEIVNAEKKAVVITRNKEDADNIYNQFGTSLVFVVHSDGLDAKTLERANLTKATTVLLNYEDDTENLVNLITLKVPYPELIYVISLNNSSLKKTFKQLGVTFTLAKNEVASKIVASYIFEPQVAKITEGLMSSSVSDDDMGLMQFKVTSQNPYVNAKGLDAFIDLKTKYNAVLVAISRLSKESDPTIFKNPTNDHSIQLDDYLVIMSSHAGKTRMSELFGVEEGI